MPDGGAHRQSGESRPVGTLHEMDAERVAAIATSSTVGATVDGIVTWAT